MPSCPVGGPGLPGATQSVDQTHHWHLEETFLAPLRGAFAFSVSQLP